jgi:hypothetical protein
MHDGTMTLGEGQAREPWPHTLLRLRRRILGAGLRSVSSMWYLPNSYRHIHLSDDDNTVEGRHSRAPLKRFDSHAPVRPVGAPPNSGGHKVGHNFKPTHGDPGHRGARHPSQESCLGEVQPIPATRRDGLEKRRVGWLHRPTPYDSPSSDSDWVGSSKPDL